MTSIRETAMLPARISSPLKSLAAVVVLVAASNTALAQQTDIRFTDVTATSGIDFVHSHGGGVNGYIVEGMSTGLATFDYDGDGWIDIYFINGAPLKDTVVDQPLTNALYRNKGDGTFEDVTAEAGVGDTGYGLGVSVADYDGDGDIDIYINNFGPNVLYRNNGDRTFTDVTQEAGVQNGSLVGAGVGFFDMEKDGDLDLYVANYVDFSYETHVPIVIEGQIYQAGPQYYNPVPDTLYRNNGDGTFTDVSQESKISQVSAPGMGLICADFDNDTDTDIYVCNDGKPNFLFLNDGNGVFEEVGLLYGAACDFDGKANSSMGVDCADYDHDGLLDLIVTNYQVEMPVLYHNLGDALFEDATARTRITRDLYPHVNWGTAFVDFDHDGDKDIFIACGHFDRIEQIDDRTTMRVKNYFLENRGGRFEDVTDQALPNPVVETSRGAAFEDFDKDGDIDVAVVNSNAKPTLLRNDSNLDGRKWIQIQVTQPGMNREGFGSRLSFSANGVPYMAEFINGRGYQSHFGSTLHFGLGDLQGDNLPIQVTWPDGMQQDVDVELNKKTVIQRQSN